jgi:hypothetical protein
MDEFKDIGKPPSKSSDPIHSKRKLYQKSKERIILGYSNDRRSEVPDDPLVSSL